MSLIFQKIGLLFLYLTQFTGPSSSIFRRIRSSHVCLSLSDLLSVLKWQLNSNLAKLKHHCLCNIVMSDKQVTILTFFFEHIHILKKKLLAIKEKVWMFVWILLKLIRKACKWQIFHAIIWQGFNIPPWQACFSGCSSSSLVPHSLRCRRSSVWDTRGELFCPIGSAVCLVSSNAISPNGWITKDLILKASVSSTVKCKGSNGHSV